MRFRRSHPGGGLRLGLVMFGHPGQYSLGEHVQLTPASWDPLRFGQPRPLPAIRWRYPHGDAS